MADESRSLRLDDCRNIPIALINGEPKLLTSYSSSVGASTVMAIALEGRIEWRMRAPYHVQIHLDQKAQPLKVPGNVSLRGKVVRVFRSDGELRCGDSVGFTIWVCQPADEPTGPAFVYYEQFVRANHVEVYLHGNPPNCQLAAYEFALISAPTDRPSMTVTQLEELARSSVPPTKPQSVPQERSWWGRMFRRRQ